MVCPRAVARRRKRTAFCAIAADRPIKRLLCAAVFTKHLNPLLGTTVYTELAATVCRYEEYEIGLGELANYGADSTAENCAEIIEVPKDAQEADLSELKKSPSGHSKVMGIGGGKVGSSGDSFHSMLGYCCCKG